VTTVQRWTGRETRALRDALRMSSRAFAARLGVNERTVTGREARGDKTNPRSEMQAALDTMLERASDEAKERFEQILRAERRSQVPTSPAEIRPSPGLPRPAEAGSKLPTEPVASAVDVALSVNGQLSTIATASQDNEDANDERKHVKRRSFLAAGGVAAFDTALSAPTRVLQALEIVTSGHADTLGIATDCLNELISHYSEKLSVSPPTDMYDDLLNVRSYAGTLLQRLRSPTRQRSDLIVAAGWLSNLLAVATSYMGDHGSALIWCVDAERLSYESGYPDIVGWAALTRAMIAYYQGRAGRSIELASNGQTIAPIGTIAHAKLAAQEMRARAMLGDAEGMVQAKHRATKAIAGLPSDVATTGVFSIALSEDPPYTATSLLLVNRFREAALITEGVIQAAYPTGTRNRNRQSSSYARTLLILGLAEAGLGQVDEAAAAGRAALNSAGLVWPTLVLAGKLDQTLMRDHRDAAEVAEYHALYLDVADRALSEFQHASFSLSRQGKK
jgi:hypothetical protein